MDQKATQRINHQTSASLSHIMQEINTQADLRTAILQLEFEQAEKGKVLKEQFMLTSDSMKPLNLIKGTLKDITSAPFLIDNLLGTVVGLSTGYLSNKIVVGASGNIIRKLLGSVLGFGVSSVVAQHTDNIKSIGHLIFRKIFHKKEPVSAERGE